MITLGEIVLIHDLKRQGLSVSAIARKLGMDRKTVRNARVADRHSFFDLLDGKGGMVRRGVGWRPQSFGFPVRQPHGRGTVDPIWVDRV